MAPPGRANNKWLPLLREFFCCNSLSKRLEAVDFLKGCLYNGIVCRNAPWRACKKRKGEQDDGAHSNGHSGGGGGFPPSGVRQTQLPAARGGHGAAGQPAGVCRP